MALNFNVQPFFDDYAASDKYYRILFRAGYAVQARELTQLQTILQQQIKRHGDHIFVNGAMVIPGQLFYSVNTSYVKLKSFLADGSSTSISLLSSSSSINPVGYKYTGTTSGAEAIVLQTSALSGTDADTLFVKYTRAGANSNTFTTGETLTRSDGTGFTLLVEDYTTDANFIGIGSTAYIESGVYYIKDNFVLVEAQNIILSKYTSTPTIKVGLDVIETVVYPETDENLLDNALGSYNYSAPGAARYSIDLKLKTVPITQTIDTTTFIPLLTLESGEIQFILNKTVYNEIDNMLARRTYDESGDYTVNDFSIKLQDYRNNYRGAWVNSTTYIIGDIVNSDTYYYTCILGHTSASGSAAFTVASNWILDNSPVYNYGLNDGVKLLSDKLGTIAQPIITSSATPEVDITPDTTKISLAVDPSKAYVRGYEIEKAATEYLTLNKARTSSSTETISIDTSPGNYILVTAVNYLPKIDTDVTFYNTYAAAGIVGTNAIATARIKQIQYHSGTVGATAVYKVFLFNMVMVSGKDFAREAKYLFSSIGGTALTRFSARVVPSNILLTGTLNASSTTTITGINTLFLSQLVQYDYVTINSGGTDTQYQVTAIASNTSLTISAATTTAVSPTVLVGSNISRVKTDLYLPALTNSTYLIPKYAVKSTSNVQYTFYERSGILTSGSATIQRPGYLFTAFSSDITSALFKNYIAISTSTGAPIAITSIAGTGTDTISAITVAGGGTFELIYAIKKSTGASPITKTITNAAGELTSTIVSSAPTVATSIAPLLKADAFEIQSIMKGTGTGAIDITSKFTLDNGQRDTHYDLASLKLNVGAYLIDVVPLSFVGAASTTATINTFVPHNLTTGDIIVISGATGTEQVKFNGTWVITVTTTTAFTVTVSSSVASGTLTANLGTAKITGGTVYASYSYFARSGGDYSTIDSYSSLYYNQLSKTIINSIDFRPTKTNTGTNAAPTLGMALPVVPVYGEETTISYNYYLGRTDKLSLDATGKYIITEGVPSANPSEPISPTNAMDLYKFYIEPYTFNANTNSVICEKVENKRYTMRDIGKIENRVKNLEYYASLSELEQNTLAIKSYDQYGIERPQNGFIVDAFTGQGIGDTTSPDWIASIDSTNNELRPSFVQQQISLVESTNSLLNRSALAQPYSINGDLVTLRIASTVPLVKQLRASRSESVNPFDSYSFIGDVELTPWSDTWFEVTRSPDVIINDNGQYDAVVNAAVASGVLGTVWNSWQETWSGVSTVNTSGRLFVTSDGAVKSASEVGVVTSQSITTRAVGTNTRIESSTKTSIINDKLVSVNIIPYMRARSVMFKGAAFKPNTKMYAFFDKVPVDTYITYAKRLTVITAGSAKGTTVPTFKTDVNFGSNINTAARKELALPYFKIQLAGKESDFGGMDNSITSPKTKHFYLYTPFAEPKYVTGQGWIPGSKVIVKQQLLAGVLTDSPSLTVLEDVLLGTISSYGEFIFSHPIYVYPDGIRVNQMWYVGATYLFNAIQHVPSRIAPVGAVYLSNGTLRGTFGTMTDGSPNKNATITSGLGSVTTPLNAGNIVKAGDWTATYTDSTVKTFTDYSPKYNLTTVTNITGSFTGGTPAVNTTTGDVTIPVVATAGNMVITWTFLSNPFYTKSVTVHFA